MKTITTIKSLLNSLTRTLNLINPVLEKHHQQTAYLAYMLAVELKINPEEIKMIIFASLLHDIGSIIKEEPEDIAAIEKNAKENAKVGAELIYGFKGAETISKIVYYSQTPWSELKNQVCEHKISSAIIHLADYASSLIIYEKPILNQIKNIISEVENLKDEFCDKALAALKIISNREYIWLDIRHNPEFLSFFIDDLGELSIDEIIDLTRFMARIIDYRSPFTAMHSAGVAVSAKSLSELYGMSEEKTKEMLIAGYLHDIGKLSVPKAILEKPGKLTEEEFNIVKQHPYYTRLILMDIEGFDDISNWAGFHHEKLNGSGYPFHFGESVLDVGARIMAVADIFSALTEKRPYRKEMEKEKVIAILKEAVNKNELDKGIVELLVNNYEHINNIRNEASNIEGKRYFESFGDK